MANLVDDLSVVVSAITGDKGIEILFSIDPLIPPGLMGDDLHLRQILLNLVSNAIKFTDRGEVLLSIRVLRKTTESVEIEFSVQDSGIGIPEDKLQYIFEGFSQAESSISRRFGGTGLGLAISKRLVVLMGGALQVESKIDKGSRFHFKLHFAIGSQSVLGSSDAARVHLKDKIRLLIVDDNAMARKVLQEIGESFGWRCDALTSGEQALAQLERSTDPLYEVILMDWGMPGLDGRETALRIRNLEGLGKSPVILMVSAHNRELITKIEAHDKKIVDGYLTKPVTASTLYSAVIEALADQEGKSIREPLKLESDYSLIGLRLLVFEDNLINEQVAQELLIKNGAYVEIARRGVDGIKLALAAYPPFDAILMDLQMPDMDGFETTRQLRAHASLQNIPIIAMTANAMDKDKEACLIAGMVAHIGKPVELDQLIRTLLIYTGRLIYSQRSPSEPDKGAVVSAHTLPDPADNSPINVEAAVKRLGGNRLLYEKLVRSFQTGIIADLAELQQHINKGQWQEIARCLHTLKGSADVLGATGLATLAGEEEIKATQLSKNEPRLDESNHKERAKGLFAELDAKVKQTLELLEANLPPLPERVSSLAPPPGLDKEGLASALRELVLLLKEGDLEATEVCARIGEQYGSMLGRRFTALEKAVSRLNLIQALEECDALLGSLKDS